MGNIKQIQRLSFIMQQLCLAGIILIPLMLAWIWLNFDQYIDVIASDHSLQLKPEYIGTSNILMGFLCSLIPAVILCYGLWRLRKLFALFCNKQFFTNANTRHLRAFSVALFANALLSPVIGALLSIILTINNPPGQRSLSIGISNHEISTLFIAATFMIIAGIMVEGRKLADENAEII